MSREDRQRRDREMAMKLKEISEARGMAKRNRAEAEAELNAKPLRPGPIVMKLFMAGIYECL